MARSLEKLQGRAWSKHPYLELAQANILDPPSLRKALEGCYAAYYLVHSMISEPRDFALADRKGAQNFVNALKGSGIERVIYLGGLVGASADLSPHLKSRTEVGAILQSGPVPVTIINAAQILGSGSASFEILRYVVERIPIVIAPSRVMDTRIQPISIRNVLIYLAACLEKKETMGQTYDIGGPDILTYRKLLAIYAKAAELRNPIIITLRYLSWSLFASVSYSVLKLLLPMPPSIYGPLLRGAVNEAVVKDYRITEIIPQKLMTCQEAIRRAIQKDSLQIVETRWTDAGELKPPEWVYSGDAPYAGGTLLKGGFKVVLDARPDEVWPVISKVGGSNGWYYGNFLWEIRGWMDTFVGGVGLRRGRRHPEQLFVGDALDFWRVLKVHPPNRLMLVAEMKLPGEAILDFEIIPLSRGSELRLGTRFRPRGLYGIMYWYILLPFHDFLFGGMLREVAKKVAKPILSGPSRFKPGPIS